VPKSYLGRKTNGEPAFGALVTATGVVYLVHAPVDWDWEMPAMILVAVIVVGALLGVAMASET
jgi:hypothetical protein